jgi:tetrahydromethanopterin S-methyltransferase subunit H
MFKFEKEQVVHDFNGTKLGGQPGEYPTVLGASIFYNKHEIVLDDKTGKIDKETAEALWNRCQELSDITGIPHFIQIIAEYGEAFESYIDWFCGIDDKTAFLMDSSVPAALAHAVNMSHSQALRIARSTTPSTVRSRRRTWRRLQRVM